MSGQNVGYIRVSSVDQNTARQLDGVSLDKVFEDKASGKDANRPQLIACMNHLRDGDTLHIHSMDRLARNLLDMRKIVDELTSKGVTVRFIKEALTFSKDKADARSELMFNMMAAFAQFERELIKERQREGIAVAKTEGKYKGGKAKLTDEQAAQIRNRAASGEKKAVIAREFGISRETLYQYLKAD
jgi:DNA invertase Pin-like site-specific DNA recombinase